MTIHNWKEHKIEVRGYTLPKYLWMALSLKIVIDDKYTFESPKELEGLKSKVPFEVIEMGNTLKGALVTRHPVSTLLTRYKIFIDGIEVIKGKVTADNWYMLYGFFLFIGVGTYVVFSFT